MNPLIIHELPWLQPPVGKRKRGKKNLCATLRLGPEFPAIPGSSSSRSSRSRLAGPVKMADCIRVPLLLLLMCILSSVHAGRDENAFVSKHAAKADSQPNPAGGPPPVPANPVVAVEKNPGAGASVLRKRNTGWKLAEEAVCRDDLTRLCPKYSWSNNLAVLECLQDRKEVNGRDTVQQSRGKMQGVPVLRHG